MTDNLLKAVIFILAVDLMLFLGQISMNNVAIGIGEKPMQFFSLNGSTLASGGTCNNVNCTLDTTDISGRIVQPTTQTSTGTGDFFTDTVKDIKNWVIESIPGLNYALMIVAAPGSILKIIGAPPEISYGIGAVWMIFTIIIIVAFITGRGN